MSDFEYEDEFTEPGMGFEPLEKKGGSSVMVIVAVVVLFLGCSGISGLATVWFLLTPSPTRVENTVSVAPEPTPEPEAQTPASVASDDVQVEPEFLAEPEPEPDDDERSEPVPQHAPSSGSTAPSASASPTPAPAPAASASPRPSSTRSTRSSQSSSQGSSSRSTSSHSTQTSSDTRSSGGGRSSEPAPSAPAAQPEPDDGGPEAVAEVEPAPAGPRPDVSACENLVPLEPIAMLGRLELDKILCLERRYNHADTNTDREKVSLVLMANAYGAGDDGEWERLVLRHLDEVSQGNPDLCYKYALWLSGQGPSRASEVVRWSELALENKFFWRGELFTTRVYTLHKLRATAAMDLWNAAESAYAKDPSDALQARAESTRSTTKTFAREWYDYAVPAGKDASMALELCRSAATDPKYCALGD